MSKKASVTLYELLRVEKDATTGEIRKAFLALAKKVHPDKQQGLKHQDDNGEAFRALKKAYDILIDPRRRKDYDRTGVVQDEDSQTFQDAYERFRGVKVTEADIDRASEEFRDSDEEKRDLKEFFESRLGNVSEVLAYICASRDQDIPRFVSFWEKELEEGRLSQTYKKTFTDTKKHILTTSELDALDEDMDVECSSEDDKDDENSLSGFIAEEDDNDEEEVDDDDDEDIATTCVFTKGDLVQARWRSGKTWYDAYVMAVHRKTNTYDVQYVRDKAKENDVPASLVRKTPTRARPADDLKDVDPSLLAMFRKKDAGNPFAAIIEKHSTKKAKKG